LHWSLQCSLFAQKKHSEVLGVLMNFDTSVLLVSCTWFLSDCSHHPLYSVEATFANSLLVLP
jgi:hypothetical protein